MKNSKGKRIRMDLSPIFATSLVELILCIDQLDYLGFCFFGSMNQFFLRHTDRCLGKFGYVE